MSACAGSSTEAAFIRRDGAPFKSSAFVGHGRFQPAGATFLSTSPAGRMGRARQDWVHEYAETGRPLQACKQHESREQIGAGRIVSIRAELRTAGWRWNGPSISGSVGHKLSAIGLPHHTAGSIEHPYRQLPPRVSSRAAAVRPAFFRSSIPLIPSLAGIARFHPTLPRVPAAISCWAER